MRTQFVNVELRSINHEVCQPADRTQMPPLCFSAAFTGESVPRGWGRRVSLKRRSRTSSEASRKTIFVGTILRTDSKMPGSLLSLDPSRTSTTRAVRRDVARLQGQFGKLRYQFDRKIVDAIVAKIFKGLQHRGLSRSAHSRNDDEFRRCLRDALGFFFASAGFRGS